MYVAEQGKGITKSRFDLAEQQKIVNFTSSNVYCMDIGTFSPFIFYQIVNNSLSLFAMFSIVYIVIFNKSLYMYIDLHNYFNEYTFKQRINKPSNVNKKINHRKQQTIAYVF